MEEWIDVKDYEGLYQVSNLGRVRSLQRKEPMFIKGVPVKKYLRVTLCKNGEHRNELIHRIVAIAFIPNPLNLPCVNHKDENRSNNCVDNLEWCTYEYNNNYGNRVNKASKSLTNRKDYSKQVKQYTLTGEYIATYPSTKEVERKFGFHNPAISGCCLGKYKQAYGFKWSYA